MRTTFSADDAPVGARDRYGLVLLAILGSLALTPILIGRSTGEAALVIVFGATLLLTYRVSHAPRVVLRFLLAIVALGIVLSLVAVLTGGTAARPVLMAVSALYVAAGPYVVVRRLLQHVRITASTVLGALCVYLLVGQFFAVVYPLISLLTHAPFFVQTSAPGAVDYLYFSFITLATVGYGDLTPAGAVGRMVAMTEGLLGQLYLVTVVAVVVGNLGRTRRTDAEIEDGDRG